MTSTAARALLAACVAAGCGAAVGAGSVVVQAGVQAGVHTGVFWPGIYPGYPFIGPLPLYAGACRFQVNCWPPWWDERRLRARAMPPSPPQPNMQTDIWSSTGSPWGYVRRLPPPTPPEQIQPQFRDASTIRPEFADR